MNRPHKKTMGNLKKFEKVWASKTSLTDTAIKSPRNVEVMAIKTILKIRGNQLIPGNPTQNKAKMIGTKAFKIPKATAPLVLAIIKRLRSMGARSNLSKDLPFFSKVIVTASIDVVPKSIDIAIMPGKIERISTSVCDRRKNISIQAKGKIMPQLIFGGLR